MHLRSTDESSVDALRQELRQNAIAGIRWRWVVGLLALIWVGPELRSLYASMNVELPTSTSLLVGALGMIEDWFWLAVPALLLGYRLFEERTLRRLSLGQLHSVARLSLAVILIALWTLWVPFCRLVNTVG